MPHPTDTPLVKFAPLKVAVEKGLMIWLGIPAVSATVTVPGLSLFTNSATSDRFIPPAAAFVFPIISYAPFTQTMLGMVIVAVGLVLQ